MGPRQQPLPGDPPESGEDPDCPAHDEPSPPAPRRVGHWRAAPSLGQRAQLLRTYYRLHRRRAQAQKDHEIDDVSQGIGPAEIGGGAPQTDVTMRRPGKNTDREKQYHHIVSQLDSLALK